MLESRSVSDISYEDIVKFCDLKKYEGQTLDYKQDISKNIAKTIAGMANTFGGNILVGVADNGDKPLLPATGLTYKSNYLGTIENLIHSHIQPVLHVETKICANSTQNLCFIVIRVPQSITTPHLFDGMPIIRTGQSSRPEDIASPDQLSWLYERRQQSILLKKSLYDRNSDRFTNWLREIGFFNPSRELGAGNAILSLSVCPVFPTEPLFSYKEAIDLLDRLARDHNMHFTQGKTRVVAGGALNAHGQVDPKAARTFGQLAQGDFDFLELEQHGFFLHRTTASLPYQQEMNYLLLAHKVIYFLAASRSLFEQTAYSGFISFLCNISNVAGRCVDVQRCQASAKLEPSYIVDKTIDVQSNFSISELRDQFEEKACEILELIAHACGLNGTDNLFQAEIIKNSGVLKNLLLLAR